MDLASGLAQMLTVSFAGPAAGAAKLSASPESLRLATPGADSPVQSKLAIALSDQTQPWTVSIFPANRTTAWLSASQLSGSGPAQVTFTAADAGFAPGVYRASIVIQSANALSQAVIVPVMFVLGASSSGTAITSVADSVSYRPSVSPGQLLSVFGTRLANATGTAAGIPLSYSIEGVFATVNGVAAPLLYVSPGQINLQVPYEVGGRVRPCLGSIITDR